MAQAGPSFCIVGAGMSGILMGIRLRQAGYKNFRIFEKAPDCGGTWFYNKYPGIACDVPAHYYSYSFFPKHDWSRKSAPGEEIHEYFQSVVSKYQLADHIEYNKEVVQGVFDGSHWQVETADGETVRVDFLISACGILHKPNVPKIPGQENYQGAVFHSSNWDTALDYKDKNIVVIGNGSTGVQLIPALAQQANHLTLLQRTPQWIMPVKDKVYSESFTRLRKLIPGLSRLLYLYHQRTFEAFTNLVLEEGWQRSLVNKLTQRALDSVRDPKLKETLTPDYEPACKRVVMSNKFYRTVQRDNVSVLKEGIAEFTETGVKTASGQEIQADIVALCTGFDAHAFMRPMNLMNEHGLSMDEFWQEGIQAYRTIAVPKFSNFFMVLGPNSPVGNFSVISAAETQTRYIMRCIDKKISGKYAAIAPKAEATSLFYEQIQAAMEDTIWVTGCSSWYLDKNGRSITWPWTPQRFRAELKKPNFADFILEKHNDGNGMEEVMQKKKELTEESQTNRSAEEMLN